jgi:hypothetical protein
MQEYALLMNSAALHFITLGYVLKTTYFKCDINDYCT